MDELSTYLETKWEIYKKFQNNMLYLDEEPKERDMATHFSYSLQYQI